MSKKKAESFSLAYLSKNRPYVNIQFIDHKGKVMRSSVDVVLNSAYMIDPETSDWDYRLLEGFVRAR